MHHNCVRVSINNYELVILRSNNVQQGMKLIIKQMTMKYLTIVMRYIHEIGHIVFTLALQFSRLSLVFTFAVFIYPPRLMLIDPRVTLYFSADFLTNNDRSISIVSMFGQLHTHRHRKGPEKNHNVIYWHLFFFFCFASQLPMKLER